RLQPVELPGAWYLVLKPDCHVATAAVFQDPPELDMHNSHARAMQLPEEGVNLKEMLADLEVELIRQALESQDGVVARAADLLGMRRTTLVEKMKKYGMSKEV
ncbi:helix-turn-helix domain-containing protein, partial [Klebsiella pneumoniae]